MCEKNDSVLHEYMFSITHSVFGVHRYLMKNLMITIEIQSFILILMLNLDAVRGIIDRELGKEEDEQLKKKTFPNDQYVAFIRKRSYYQ